MEGGTSHVKNYINPMQPGLLHDIYHEEGNSCKIQVKLRALNGKVKILTVDVDTASTNHEFGKTFAKFLYNKPVLIEKKFHKVSQEIRQYVYTKNQ